MTTTYTGTQEVEPGLYLDTKTFSITHLDKRGPLPGAENATYRRVPMLVMLAVAPLLGLVFVIFLPFIGFAAVAYLAVQKTRELATGVAGQMGRVRRPAWAPTLAFLSRSKPAEPQGKADPAPPDAWAEDVEKKLNETDRTAR